MASAATTTVSCLSPEIEGLLLDVLADGFAVYCCGPKAAPTALVAAYHWPHHIDLLTIRDFTRITAARVPKRGDVHPQHPDAPRGEYPAPPSLRVRRAEQRPMTIRLPSPERTEARARRLTPEPPVQGQSDAMVGR